MNDVPIGSRVLQPNRQLLADGERVQLGPRALDILSRLAEADGAIVTKDELLDAVWHGVTVEENALQVHIGLLRKALGDDAYRLRTVRGIGYQLDIGATNGAVTGAGNGAATAHETMRSQRRWPVKAFAVVAGLLALAALALAVFGTRLASDMIGARPTKPIAILVRPFAPSGTGGLQEAALARGITDELIVRLRRVPELRVGTAGPGDDERVGPFAEAYLVDGTIRTDGDQLRIAVRLADKDGTILWSDAFDQPFSELFRMQEQIAALIGYTLSVSLDVGMPSRDYGGTDNPQAFAAFVQGLDQNLNWDDRPTGLRHLRRAVALDPDYVVAWYVLVEHYGGSMILEQDGAKLDALLANARDASLQAYRAGPKSFYGVAARATYSLAAGDIPAAARFARQAQALDTPPDPLNTQVVAQLDLALGRAQRAFELYSTVADLDPLWRNNSNLIRTGVIARRYREALNVYEAIDQQQRPEAVWEMFHAFWAKLYLTSEEDALRFLEDSKFRGLQEQLAQYRSSPEVLTMSEAQVRAWAQRTYHDGGQSALAYAAILAAHDGHEEAALRLLKVAFERPGLTVWFIWHPALAEVRKTDGFEQLVTDLGFVEAWRESGDWGDFCRPAAQNKIECR